MFLFYISWIIVNIYIFISKTSSSGGLHIYRYFEFRILKLLLISLAGFVLETLVIQFNMYSLTSQEMNVSSQTTEIEDHPPRRFKIHRCVLYLLRKFIELKAYT